MTRQATLTRHPLPAVPLRPRTSTHAALPALWAQLDTAQQHQIAILIAELIRRVSTPLRPHEETTDDDC